MADADLILVTFILIFLGRAKNWDKIFAKKFGRSNKGSSKDVRKEDGTKWRAEERVDSIKTRDEGHMIKILNCDWFKEMLAGNETSWSWKDATIIRNE